jgi:anti-sigma-K factor RskA
LDIKEYIASGIIESYVLGSASKQERREVECLSSIYPEIKEELALTQRTIEKYAEKVAIAPPTAVKESLFEQIKGVPQDKPVPHIEQSKSDEENANKLKHRAKVVRFTSTLKYSAAAAVAGLIIVSTLLVSKQQETTQIKEQMASLEQEKATEISSLRKELKQIEKNQFFILNSATTKIAMNGTAVSPSSQARVFWNKENKEFLLIADRLPNTAENKQYQLWAIVNDEPKSLGLLKDNNSFDVPKPIDFAKVDAFAITLEPQGGSKSPTLEAMYVLGAV